MADHRDKPSRTCPRSVLDQIGRFELHADAYRRQEYNETQIRREFIDPLFAALGWDVDNESGHAEAYKDVIHEDAIKVGGSTKAPDYCYRIGGGADASNEYCYQTRIGYDSHCPVWNSRQ